MEEQQQTLPIDEKIVYMWSELEKMEERLRQTNDALTTGTEKLDLLNKQYSDYFEKADPSLKSKSEVVIENFLNTEQSLKAAQELKSGIEEFRTFIYGNESAGVPGFKKDIENDRATLLKKNEDSNKQWEGSYQTLYEKINGLLPRATATGLSFAYQQQKRSLQAPIIISSIVLILSLGAMMWFSWETFSSIKNFEDSLKGIVSRLPFFIPAVWLAYLAAKQQNKHQRLQQEYIYKETLSKSYEAYKREVDQLPDSAEKTQLQQDLIRSMVTMFDFNPSITLENIAHDEKHPFWGKNPFKRKKKTQAAAENGS